MRKIILGFIFLLLLNVTAGANETDDKNIKELFDASKKIRPYGEETWLLELTKPYSLPNYTEQVLDPGIKNPEYKIYAMESSAIDNKKSDPTYPDFYRQFQISERESFSPGNQILFVCLPKDITFNDFRENIFRPWIPLERKATNKNWLNVTAGGKMYRKPKFHQNHGWIFGVRSIRDFIMFGQEGKIENIDIEKNEITFIAPSAVCFYPGDNDGKNKMYVYEWSSPDGKPLETLNEGKKYTLKGTGKRLPPAIWRVEP